MLAHIISYAAVSASLVWLAAVLLVSVSKAKYKDEIMAALLFGPSVIAACSLIIASIGFGIVNVIEYIRFGTPIIGS